MMELCAASKQKFDDKKTHSNQVSELVVSYRCGNRISGVGDFPSKSYMMS